MRYINAQIICPRQPVTTAIQCLIVVTNLQPRISTCGCFMHLSHCQVELINDFVAQGYGMLTLGDDEVQQKKNRQPVENGCTWGSCWGESSTESRPRSPHFVGAAARSHDWMMSSLKNMVPLPVLELAQVGPSDGFFRCIAILFKVGGVDVQRGHKYRMAI